jgi:hypothetical protein
MDVKDIEEKRESSYSPQDQPISEEQRERIDRAYALFEQFYESIGLRHMEMRDFRDLRRMEDRELMSEGAPKLNTLNSTIDNVIADQMDNLPAAVILPETPEKAATADLMTDVVRYALDAGGFEDEYARVMEDSVVTGTGVLQTFWDEDMERGDGLVNVQAVKPETIYPDPFYENWQDGRAIFRTTHTTFEWIAQHFPDAAQYVKPDEWAQRGEGEEMAERAGGLNEDDLCMVLEYWWREYDAKKRKYKVHTMLLSGHALLEDSRDTKPGGVYAHGEYPFIAFPYRMPDGEPFGRGLMDDYAPTWRAICRYAKYIDVNARLSSRTRYIVRRGMDVDDLSDLTKDFIEFGDTDSVREFQTQPLNPQVMNFMQYLSDSMKQDSGQNQFSRGEGGMGVTAAGAIEALIEAGGKTTRMHTRQYKEGFRNVVRQMIWILAEYMDKKRVLMITGGDTLEAVDEMGLLKAREMSMADIAYKGKRPMPPPPYNVRVQVQRRSPLEMQAWNDQVYNIANLCAQAQMPMPPSAVVAMLRGMEEKQTVLRMVRENDQTRAIMQKAMADAQQAQAQAQALSEENDALRKMTMSQHEALAQREQQQAPDGYSAIAR